MSEALLGREHIFSGRVIEVFRDQVELQDGTRTVREVVAHQGSVAVVVLDAGAGRVEGRDRILLVRQYRYAAQQDLWEIPAGRVDSGETPAAAAARELAEEAGLAAAQLSPMLSMYPTPGYSTERLDVFLARDLRPCTAQADPDERITADWLDIAEAEAMCLDGRIVDAKTIAAVLAVRAAAKCER